MVGLDANGKGIITPLDAYILKDEWTGNQNENKHGVLLGFIHILVYFPPLHSFFFVFLADVCSVHKSWQHFELMSERDCWNYLPLGLLL